MDAILPALLLVFVVAMMVGPIMLMRPSSHQKKLAKLRFQAQQAGLLVHIGEERSASGRNLAEYLLPRKKPSMTLPEWRLRKQSTPHEIHIAEYWRWVGQAPSLNAPMTEQLTQLVHSCPNGVLAFGVNRVGVFICWTEQLSSQTPQDVTSGIKTWLDQLLVFAQVLGRG